MEKNSELINVLCYKLSGDISRAVFNEYNNRWSEIKHIWEYPQNRFKVLESYQSTVKLLLAMSTFYRRVLSGLNGACDFYKTVTKNQQSSRSIVVGSYRLDRDEYNRLLAIQITFRNLREKYGITEHFFDYSETEEFLTNCKDILNYNVKSTTKSTSGSASEDLPF